MEADGLTVDLMKMKLGISKYKCDRRLRVFFAPLSLFHCKLLAINERDGVMVVCENHIAERY